MILEILIVVGVLIAIYVAYDAFKPKKESPEDKIPWNDEARAERRELVALQEKELSENPANKKALLKKHERELEDFAKKMNDKFGGENA